MSTKVSQRNGVDKINNNNNNKISKDDKLNLIDEDGIHHEYEFGGPLGTLAMMIGFPSLFYYLYVCLFFYDGKVFFILKGNQTLTE